MTILKRQSFIRDTGLTDDESYQEYLKKARPPQMTEEWYREKFKNIKNQKMKQIYILIILLLFSTSLMSQDTLNVIDKGSTDLISKAFYKIFGRSDDIEQIVGDAVGFSNGKDFNVITELKFVDNNGKSRNIKVTIETKNTWSLVYKVQYSIDGALSEYREFKDENPQWINAGIPDDRILISVFTLATSTNTNNTVMQFRVICVLERLDKKEVAPNITVSPQITMRPCTLIEKKINLNEDVIHYGFNFCAIKTFFIGKDGQTHSLRIETDNIEKKLPSTNICRLYFDYKLIAEVNQPYKKNNDNIQFTTPTSEGILEVLIQYKRLGPTKDVKVTLIN